MSLLTEFLIGLSFSGLVFVAFCYTAYRFLLRPLARAIFGRKSPEVKAEDAAQAAAEATTEHKDGALVDRGNGVFEVVCAESQEEAKPLVVEHEMPSSAMTYEPLEDVDAEEEPLAFSDAETAPEDEAASFEEQPMDWAAYDAPTVYRADPYWQPQFVH